MLKTFKTEIDPTPEQKIIILRTIGVCRYVYNFYITQTKEWHVRGHPFQSAFAFSKYEVAIAAVNQLNRLSVAKGLAPLYDGPTDDAHRTAVGDFCGQIMGEYFNDRYTQKLSVETLLGENEGEEFAAAVAKLTEKAGLVQ